MAAVSARPMALDGCKKTEEVVEASGADGGSRLQIRLNFDPSVTGWQTRGRDVFVSTIRALGVGMNVQNVNGDVQGQIEQIEYSIKKQMDVTAVATDDCDVLSDVVRKAKDMGIRTVSYDRLITNADCDLYISSDNEEVGWLMIRCFLECMPEDDDIFMIQEPETDGNVFRIRKGFNEVLAGSGLNVVYKANCKRWLAEYTFIYVKEGLVQHRDVKDVMCGNDNPTTQAFRTLSGERLAGRVVLTGRDGDLMACQRIVESIQGMIASKSVEEEARPAAEYAVKLGKGEKLADITKTIDDGTYEVPRRELVPVAVTRNSMDEVTIKGGSHIEEDVYSNVRK